jgi:hypothetical protein
VDSAACIEAWTWVRGIRHLKNEYADRPRCRLAPIVTSQGRSSLAAAWLSARQAKRQFPGYDPDVDFTSASAAIAAGERFQAETL